MIDRSLTASGAAGMAFSHGLILPFFLRFVQVFL
jgi:hypothetical protein